MIYLLDDAHRLADPAFSALLLFLGLRLPERVRLVVLSRGPVFDARAKLALGDRLLEIGSADLRLTPEGAADYARRCGLRLTPGDAEALVRDTGGWFAMVYLWLEHYRQQGAWPAPGAGADALVDEALFAPLSPERQGFLVRLGLTEGLSAQGAAFLFPGLDAPALLEELAGQNAFLTCTGGVWRCHHLLRACARERFARFSPEEQRAVLDRLGQWYAQTGETRAAAQCFARAESWDALLDAVGADGGLSLGPEALPLAREWMEACPEEALLRHPQAILVFLLLLFYARDLPGMERYHALLDRSMAQCAGLSPVLRDQLEGEALLRLSFLAFNDISAMSAYHRRIRALLPLPRNPWTQGSPSVLLLYHSHPGALDRENGEMAECMPIYSRAAGGHGSGAAALMAGETALLRGDFAEAAILCRRAESQAREGAEPSIGAAAAFLAARLALYEDTPRDGGIFSAGRGMPSAGSGSTACSPPWSWPGPGRAPSWAAPGSCLPGSPGRPTASPGSSPSSRPWCGSLPKRPSSPGENGPWPPPRRRSWPGAAGPPALPRGSFMPISRGPKPWPCWERRRKPSRPCRMPGPWPSPTG